MHISVSNSLDLVLANVFWQKKFSIGTGGGGGGVDCLLINSFGV